MENIPKIKNETSTEMVKRRELKDCNNCKSDLVQDVDHYEVGDDHWSVCLSCPNCGNEEIGLFDQATCERFDEDLDIGTAQMVQALKDITEHIVGAEVTLFAYALQNDHILPEDF